MTFDEWLNEQEGYGLRLERLNEDLKFAKNKTEHHVWVVVEQWLRASYQVGYEAGLKDKNKAIADLIVSLVPGLR